MIRFQQKWSKPLPRLRQMSFVLAIPLVSLAASQPPPEQPAPIEELDAPKPEAPPAVNSDKQLDNDLRRLRGHRRRRDKEEKPKGPTALDRLQKALDDEAQIPHAKNFFVELALVGSSANTLRTRQGYTSEVSVHFNAAYRLPKALNAPAASAPPPDKSPDFWLGLRVAPFYGRGFYRGHPGGYGLTYFGPMIAVGKIDPPPPSGGSGEAGKAAEAAAKSDRPMSSGWLLSGGIAAVSKHGRSEVPEEVSSDFATKGVALDVPGIWVEIRNMYVMLGAVGVDVLAGVQTGKDKAFFYAGLGFAGWD